MREGARRHRLAAFWVAALTTLAIPAGVRASPQDVFGYGGRTQGMAMTGTAYAEGYEAVFANPAGLAAARQRNLTVGFSGGGYRLDINGQDQPITPPRGMTIGFALPLPFGDVLKDRLVFGGAFYTPANVLLRGTVRFPQVPQWPVMNRAQSLAVMVGLGIDLHGLVDGLQIGVAVSALANVIGQLNVQLDESNEFSSVVNTQLISSYSPIVGARYTQDRWGIGVTYRHQLTARMRLDIHTADLPVTLPVLTVGGLVQYDPPTLLAEGYYKPTRDLMLVLNLTTRFWNTFPGTQIPTTSGSLNAPSPGFSPTPSPRIAAEYTVRNAGPLTMKLRAGYAFAPTPAPPARNAPRRTASGQPIMGNTVAYRLLDNDRHVLTAGLGVTLDLGSGGEKLVLDVFGQAHILQPRTHRIGLTDGGPPMTTGGFILFGGWTLGLYF